MYDLKRVKGFIFVVLSIFLLYYGTWHFTFVWDDHFFFQESQVLNPQKPWEAFFLPLPSDMAAYYRPLPAFVFALMLRIGGGSPYPFHVLSLLIHMVNSSLVMAVLWRIFEINKSFVGKSDFEQYPVFPVVLAATLFYALHPAMVESVCWVSSQFDMQMTFWLLVLAYVGLLSSGRWAQFFIGLPLYFFACGSKEMSLTFPPVYFLLLCLILGNGRRFALIAREVLVMKSGLWAGMIVGGILYALIRFHVMGGVVTATMPSSPDSAHVAYFANVFRAVFWYLKILVSPFYGLGPYSDIASLHSFQYGYLLGGLVSVSLVAVLVWKSPTVGWPFLLFLLAISLVAHTLPVSFGSAFVSERYLTYPLAIFAIACGTSMLTTACRNNNNGFVMSIALQQILHRYGYAVAIGVFVLLGLCSRSMVGMWTNDRTLWSWVYLRYPDSPYALSMLSASYSRVGDCDRLDALLSSSHAARMSVTDIAQAQCLLNKDPKKAAEIIENSLKKNYFFGEVQMVAALDTLASAYASLENFGKSFEIFEDLLHDDPRRAKVRMRYAQALLRGCEKKSADQQYSSALSAMPPVNRPFWQDQHARWLTDYESRCLKKDETRR